MNNNNNNKNSYNNNNNKSMDILRRDVLLGKNYSFFEVLALSPGELTGTITEKDGKKHQ